MPSSARNPVRTASPIAPLLGRLRAACAVTVRALLALAGASTRPVTYTIRCNMVGSLNGAPVSGPLTITATGDTNDMIPPDGEDHPYAWSSDLRVTFALAGHGSFSGNPSHFLIASAGPTLGFLMMSPDEPDGTPGFLLKTSRACGYDVGSVASAQPIAYERAHPYPGTIHTQAGWLRIDSVAQCEFRAVVADARGAAAAVERRSFAQACASLGVPDRRRGAA